MSADRLMRAPLRPGYDYEVGARPRPVRRTSAYEETTVHITQQPPNGDADRERAADRGREAGRDRDAGPGAISDRGRDAGRDALTAPATGSTALPATGSTALPGRDPDARWFGPVLHLTFFLLLAASLARFLLRHPGEPRTPWIIALSITLALLHVLGPQLGRRTTSAPRTAHASRAPRTPPR